MTIPALLIATTTTGGAAVAPGASASSPPGDWGWVLALIGVGGALVLYLLFKFYKELQGSEFISNLLGLPTGENRTRHTASPSAFRFAEEFLARRTEFWLLYAQVFVAIFFIAAITALLLIGVVDVEAGLPALSTVVGIVLGKTLLSAKGTPLSTQEQLPTLTPSNVEPPTITPGAGATVGTELTAGPGEWSGQLPMTYAYSWRRKQPNGEAVIQGQSASTYTTVAEDEGASISVMISASNTAGVATAVSQPVTISAAPPPPAPPPAPPAPPAADD
jgi:hypothetical protein